ncbi:MAG: carbohydrate kinase family protein [Candidatus Gastranaerophilales bacterium]|nr:carbohydrate kinase family protein [Candidatus Gastranaerophilales bacterium]
MFDIITIGSATQDIFIESDCAKILSSKDKHSKEELLCFDYGAKIEIDQLAFDVGGGGINAAVNFSNLGYKTAAIAKIGTDLNATAVLNRLDERAVFKTLIKETDKYKTGFSVILTSFEGDRTVLAHRGANSHMNLKDIPWEDIKKAQWRYIAPLSHGSNHVLDEIAQFAEENNVSMAFNPGTTQIKCGIDKLKKVIKTAEVLIMNKSEAANITGIKIIPESINDVDIIPSDVKKMLKALKSFEPKIAVVTDGNKGAFAYNGKVFYQCNIFPAKVVSTLGAGDAFSSTFVASIIKYDWDIAKALKLASINSASIVGTFGAQQGLKTFEELEEILSNKPDFKIYEEKK